MPWDYAAHRATIMESCKGIVRPPWSPLTKEDLRVRGVLRQRRAHALTEAEWTGFLLTWWDVASRYWQDYEFEKACSEPPRVPWGVEPGEQW